MGLVNKVVPAARTRRRRQGLDRQARRSGHQPRSRWRSVPSTPIPDNIRGISNSALHAVKLFYDTAESKEGVAAFNEKRECRTSTSSPMPVNGWRAGSFAIRSARTAERSCKENTSARKVIISCAVTGLDPHAFDVAASAGDGSRDRRSPPSVRCRRRALRSCISTPAIRPMAGRTNRRKPSSLSCASSSSRSECGREPDDRRLALHDRGGARSRPAATWKPEVASLNMGSMNFGLFPMSEALQGV